MDETIISVLRNLTCQDDNCEIEIYPGGVKYEPQRFGHIHNRTTGNNLIFIDGGQAGLFYNQYFCLSMLRTCAVYVKHNKPVKKIIKNHLIMVRLIDSSFKCIMNNTDSTSSETLVLENCTDAEAVSGDIRRILELRLALESLEEADEGDIIILDGSLHIKNKHEKEIITALSEKCVQKSVLLTALSKSCGYITNLGIPFNVYISKKPGKWYYDAGLSGSDDHPANVYFAKLHAKSGIVFPFDISCLQTGVDVSKVLGTLAINSRDPIFLGYPYGLITADKYARISNQQKKIKQMMLRSRYKDLELFKDAHDILDNIT